MPDGFGVRLQYVPDREQAPRAATLPVTGSVASPSAREPQLGGRSTCGQRPSAVMRPASPKPPPPSDSPSEEAIVAKFVRAWESADLNALVALPTDDVFISMPPMPFEYKGRDVVARFCDSIFGAGRRFDLVRTRANGQPAFGPTCAPPTASAMARGSTSSPSRASGSAP
jgi:ketosteroid isomerase-like protein